MLKRLYVGIMLLLTMVVSGAQFAQPAYAACPPDTLLGIPAWYRGIQDKSSCGVKVPETKDTNGKMKPDVQKLIMTIALNVIQAGLALVAYITIFFIIKGGFGYMTSAGSSDGMSSAKKTITNAVIGLVIAVFAASIVNAVAGFIN
jgi:hypothetical protein